MSFFVIGLSPYTIPQITPAFSTFFPSISGSTEYTIRIPISPSTPLNLALIWYPCTITLSETIDGASAGFVVSGSFVVVSTCLVVVSGAFVVVSTCFVVVSTGFVVGCSTAAVL